MNINKNSTPFEEMLKKANDFHLKMNEYREKLKNLESQKPEGPNTLVFPISINNETKLTLNWSPEFPEKLNLFQIKKPFNRSIDIPLECVKGLIEALKYYEN
jgi:hypothetical protein